MKNIQLVRSLLRITAQLLCGALVWVWCEAALASTWTGTSSTWDNPASWIGAVPNAVAAVADFTPAPTEPITTTISAGLPVTVGAINYGNNSDIGDFSWLITNTGGITLDQDGAGAGFATITNSSATAGLNNTLAISSGTITLADDLQVTATTTGSQFINGSVTISSVIAGTGNLRLNSSQPIDTAATNTSTFGAIKLSGANVFTGTTTIERGLIAFTSATGFGPVGNQIVLGTGNSDDITLLRTNAATNGTVTITNPIVVTPNHTGAITIGGLHNAGTGVTTFSGNVSLGSNLIMTGLGNINTRAVNFTGTISGDGGITKVGAGFVQIIPASLSNTYSGDTVITEGFLVTAGGNGIPDGVGKGNVFVDSAGTLVTGANETINGLSGSGIVTTGSGGSRTLTVGGNNVTSAFSGTMQNVTTGTPRAFTFVKTGTGTFTHSGTSTYTGATTIGAGTFNFTGTHTAPTIPANYNVSVDGTLAGTGNISSTINLTGKIAPGNAVDANTVGTFMSGGLTFQNGSRGVFELNPSDMTPGMGINDYIDVVGPLTAADLTTINIDIQAVGGGNLSGTGTWTLASYDSLVDGGTQTFNVTGVAGGYAIDFVPDDNMNPTGPGALKLMLGVSLPGDFNGDGKVNAADYVLWRKDPSSFLPATYDTWRGNFGNPPGSGSSLEPGTAVPEPAACVILLILAIACLPVRPGRRC